MLTTPSASYLLVVLDESTDDAKDHAVELLEALRGVWPKGHWHAFASDHRFEVGSQIEVRGALSDKKVWTTLAKPLPPGLTVNGPFDPRDRTVGRASLACRTDCYRRTCDHWECMEISVETVQRAVDARLQNP